MTRTEAIRAALRAAVRDGDTELAKALTKIAAEEPRISRLARKSVPLFGTDSRADRGKS